MTTNIDKAYDEGLHREQGLFGDRKGWTHQDWWERKLFLDDQIKHETDLGDKYRLWGRIQAVQLEGRRLFEKGILR